MWDRTTTNRWWDSYGSFPHCWLAPICNEISWSCQHVYSGLSVKMQNMMVSLLFPEGPDMKFKGVLHPLIISPIRVKELFEVSEGPDGRRFLTYFSIVLFPNLFIQHQAPKPDIYLLVCSFSFPDLWWVKLKPPNKLDYFMWGCKKPLLFLHLFRFSWQYCWIVSLRRFSSTNYFVLFVFLMK